MLRTRWRLKSGSRRLLQCFRIHRHLAQAKTLPQAQQYFDSLNKKGGKIINPFGAVVTQNKLATALMWERQELFSPQTRAWIVEHIPETRRLAVLDTEQLPREEWVLKSDYGCEGDSVVLGAFTKPSDWRLVLATTIKKHWVAQRFFEVAPIVEAENKLLPNYGVYLLGGRAAGLFTRLSQQATDYTSVTAPTFVAATGSGLR